MQCYFRVRMAVPTAGVEGGLATRLSPLVTLGDPSPRAMGLEADELVGNRGIGVRSEPRL